MREKVGLIQVRGYGDIIISLPIANYYVDNGCDVFMAVDERFSESLQVAAPYVKFIPISNTFYKPEMGISNPYWYEIPRNLLEKEGCNVIMSFPYDEMNLYTTTKDSGLKSYLKNNRLSGPYESKAIDLNYHEHVKFDEFKYLVANVPFKQKWNLVIHRNWEREEKLFNSLNLPDNYSVTHLEGSNIKYNVKDLQIPGHVINIESSITDNIFDWLTVIEKSQNFIGIDSVFVNLIDQLNILKINKHFIRRSVVKWTPVLANHWNYVGVNIALPSDGISH